MIEFTEAALIALVEIEPMWRNMRGHLYISSDGLEDDDWYVVYYGAREWFFDMDIRYMTLDQPLAFVNKHTGEFRFETHMTSLDRLDAMRPVHMTAAQRAQFDKDAK